MRLYDFIERLSARLVVRWGAPIPDVIQLRPRAISLAKAKALFATGHFEACVEGLKLDMSDEGIILHARALLRLDLVVDARSLLEANQPAESNQKAFVTHGAWLCRALARTTEIDEILFSKLSQLARKLSDTVVLNELCFAQALQEFVAEKYALASSILLQYEKLAIGRSRVEMLSTLGVIAAIQGNAKEKVRYSRAALECYYDEVIEQDDYLELHTLNNLAGAISDSFAPEDQDYLLTRVAEVKAGLEPRNIRCSLFLHCGWIAAIVGDYITALANFREAANLASTPALKAVSFAWRAYIAYEMNEPLMSAECINDAQLALDEVNWAETSGEECDAFLALAEVLAYSDTKRALALLEVYSAVKSKVTRLAQNGHDVPIDRARLLQVRGAILRAEGHYTEAHSHFLQAFELFQANGAQFRAANAALDAHELVGDPILSNFALTEAAKLPKSLLARRLTQKT